MMMIAVLISGMLMPAQIFAKSDKREVKKENRVSVDYNRVKKDNKVVKYNPAPKKPVVVKHHNPAPAPVVVHHNPAPVVVHHNAHCAPPPPVHHHHCNDVANAAAVAIGVVGLISLLAN